MTLRSFTAPDKSVYFGVYSDLLALLLGAVHGGVVTLETVRGKESAS